MSIKSNKNKSFIENKYRPEIDGLRAFAVITVIINHFNKEILPNGYLGVDIFFVISGFVITSSLYQRPSKNFKDFIIGFYERRIKRLIPALTVFVLITSITFCLFNSEPTIYLRTGITSLFGLSNLYLLRQSTDYFAQSTELHIFAHTWSLGVEEQFYILFPFLIWFSGFGRQTKNGARNLFLIVGILAVTSLIGFVYLYPINQSAAYFLMPTRFWEMAAGCLLFIGIQNRQSVKHFLVKIPAIIVLTLIIGTMYLPVSWATTSTIAIVILSSVFIASLTEQTKALSFFTNPKVVYIGLISYPLYLWHWGVISISRWTIGVHWWSVPFQIILILVLAITSYNFIEAPLRRKKWFKKRLKTLTFGVGLLVSFAGILFIFDKEQKIFLGTPKTPFGEEELKESFWSRKNCSGSRKSQNIANKIKFDDCFMISSSKESPKAKKTLFVYGDSLAQQIIPILADLTDKDKYIVNIVYSSGCPSLFNVEWSRENPIGICSKRWNNYFSWVTKVGQKGDILLLANSTHYYYLEQDTNSSLKLKGKSLTREESHKMLSSDLIKTANTLDKNDMNLVVSSGIPIITLSNCDQWFQKYNNRCKVSTIINIKLSEQVKDTRNFQLLAAKEGNFLILDSYNKIRNIDLEKNNQDIQDFYYNEGHLNSKGVRYFIYPVLVETLNKL